MNKKIKGIGAAALALVVATGIGHYSKDNTLHASESDGSTTAAEQQESVAVAETIAEAAVVVDVPTPVEESSPPPAEENAGQEETAEEESITAGPVTPAELPGGEKENITEESASDDAAAEVGSGETESTAVDIPDESATEENEPAVVEEAEEEAAAEEPVTDDGDAETAEEQEEEEEEHEYSVTILCNITPDTVVVKGDTIVLTAKLSGFEGKSVAFQWMVLEQGVWQPIKGATGASYSFEASEESMSRSYDVRVTLVNG